MLTRTQKTSYSVKNDYFVTPLNHRNPAKNGRIYLYQALGGRHASYQRWYLTIANRKLTWKPVRTSVVARML